MVGPLRFRCFPLYDCTKGFPDMIVDRSAAFEEFLGFLGDKVDLMKHTAYSGGLSTKGNTNDGQ